MYDLQMRSDLISRMRVYVSDALRNYIKTRKIRSGTKHTEAEAHIMRYSSSGFTSPWKSVDEKDRIAVPAALCKMRYNLAEQ